ncbi:MAG: tetratricopeptide repeat protein [Chloroflexota bacterium]|nr:tetratricopeptide repeat protein [Chloroflexota bacterium]MDQ5866959.1 tetratricopeptide repeat protein [Chloroflexota bacterium]
MEASLARKKQGFQGGGTLFLGVVLLLIAAGLLARPFISAPASASSVPAPVDAEALLTTGGKATDGYTDRVIGDMQARLKSEPGDYQALASLGVAYQQKARETNDPAYYAEAEKSFQQALSIKPDDYNSLAGMGALELSRHNFKSALDWGNKATKVLPNKAYAYGVIGDAHIELGNYDQAVAAFQKMVDLRPDLSSYSRVSYARELHGDVEGAIQAMQQAVTAGGPAAENTAWCRVQLGNLYFNSNRLDEAEKAYSEALGGYPGFLHAQAGLAQVKWARGDTAGAIDLYKQATASVPLPQYIAALGDLYTSTGDKQAAAEQYELVEYIYDLQGKGGVVVDIERAAFYADHDIQLAEALQLAQAAAADRNDVHTLDTLAWALYKNGRYDEALSTQQRALRLGTRNATFYYHLGMIQNALGEEDQARVSLGIALDINPNFSPIYSPQARAFLDK